LKLGRAGMKFVSPAVAALVLLSASALAGPPYVTDDPQPTDEGHFEVYGFTGGTAVRDRVGGQAGIDFNYGGAADLQLTMVLPFAFDAPNRGSSITGFGDIELAAKYKFLHQKDFGIDVAVFPRLFCRQVPILHWAVSMRPFSFRSSRRRTGAIGAYSAVAAARSIAAASHRTSARWASS
jgi:hypothetical protein